MLAQPQRSSRIDKGSVCGPQAHDDLHRSATGRAEGDERCRGCKTSRLTIDALCLHDQQAEGVGRQGTTGLEQAEIPDVHAALGPDVLEAPAEPFHAVERGGGAHCQVHERCR